MRFIALLLAASLAFLPRAFAQLSTSRLPDLGDALEGPKVAAFADAHAGHEKRHRALAVLRLWAHQATRK